MKNKGFSLVELMGIIIILSLISLLVIPSIDRSIKNFKLKAYNSQIQNIKLATEDWVIDNLGKYALLENETLTIFLSQLKAGGYLEEEFINPNTDLPFNDDMQINVTRVKDSLKYFVIENSGSEDEYLEELPIITLNGSFVERIKPGGKYTERGATATDHTKTIDLTSKVGITYYSGTNYITLATLQNGTPGTYTARYSINNENQVTRYVYRLVIVS